MRELLPWLRLILVRRRRLATGALLILLTLVSGLGLLALSGWFITATAVTGLLLAAGIAASLNIYVPGGGIRLFAVTRTVARYLERVYNHDTVLRLLADIRIQLFRGLSRQPPRQGSRLRGADWLSRLTSDLDAMDTLYLRLIAPTGLALLVSLLVVLAAWLWYSPELALAIAMALGTALLVATALLYRRTRTLSAARTEQLGQLRGRLIEHLEGQAELRAAGLVQTQANKLCVEAQGFSGDQARVDQLVGRHQALSALMVNLGALAALGLGLMLFDAEHISGPVAITLPLAILGLIEVYAMLPDAFGRLGATQASAHRLNEDCSWASSGVADGIIEPIGEPDPVVSGQDHPNNGQTYAIELRDIVIGYRPGAEVIDGLSLDLRQGEHLGLIGASGCGKSSLADVLAGLATPTAGRLHRSPGHHRVAYLTQPTTLFEDTVRNNLVPDGTAVADERLWRVLELVELGARVAALPGQLDGWLGAHGSQLSGGEGRRLALARVLLREADLVILDEPFTGVDRQTQGRIRQQLSSWLEGRTLVALGHGEDALPLTDRIVRLGAAD